VDIIASNAGSKLTSFCQLSTYSSPSTSTESLSCARLTHSLLLMIKSPVIGSLPSLLSRRHVYSLISLPCKLFNSSLPKSSSSILLSVVAILDSLAQPNSHEGVSYQLCKWLEAVCATKSVTKPNIQTFQVAVRFSFGCQDSTS
jgi:hypothetical protein